MTNPASSASSRRGFLRTAAAIAAAGGLQACATKQPSRVEPQASVAPPPAPAKPDVTRAQPEVTPPPAPSSTKPIGPAFALIGCGGQGMGDAKNAAKLGRIVAVCDVDQNRIAAAKKQWPEAETYTDFRKLLERKDVEAVICATPDHWHTLVSIAAMRAGKDVYCEKPLTLTIEEGQHLVKVQRETGRVLQTGTQQRSQTYFRTAAELVRNGVLGPITAAKVWVPAGWKGGPFKSTDAPAGFDYDTWLGPAPQTPYVKERTHMSFRYWWDYSGGTITDWGAHHNDIVLWALGYDRSGPVAVEGEVVTPPVPGGYSVPSEYKIKYTYDNGVVHTCHSTLDSKWNGETVNPKGQVHGIRFEGTDGRWIWVTRGSWNASNRDLLKESNLPAGATRLYKSNDHMANFVECVKTRKEPICPAEVGHRSATLCHLGGIAVRLGRKLQWDPSKEQFVNDAEAQKQVAREMRKPFAYGYVGGV